MRTRLEELRQIKKIEPLDEDIQVEVKLEVKKEVKMHGEHEEDDCCKAYKWLFSD